MANNAWHEQCILRDDVRQGTLELAEFAADSMQCEREMPLTSIESQISFLIALIRPTTSKR